MSFDRLKYCKCSECMLNDKTKVKSEESFKNGIAIIGEAPGKNENETGQPFCGKSGWFMNDYLARVGISRYETYIMNVVQCQPPGNNIDGTYGQSGVECCKDSFIKEIDYLIENGIKVLIPMGNTALHALGIDEKISVARGSIYTYKNTAVIPTYHPAYIVRQQHELVTWLNDLSKAEEYSHKKYVPPEENFNIFPTIEDIEAFTKDCVENKRLVAVDTETTQLEPQLGEIVVTGMAIDEVNAISFPKLKKNGYEYWTNGERIRARDCLQEILLKCPLLFQNALYDCYWLEEKGFEIGEIKHDTLILHSVINPELRHRLEYINSIYGKGPAWKSEYSSHKIPILSKDDEVVRPYNLRDCVVLHQCMPGMLKDAKDVIHIYEDIGMKVIRPLLEMQRTGLVVNKKELSQFRKYLDNKIDDLETKMRKLCNLPKSFNFNSDQHQLMLLFNKQPGWVNKRKEELASYDAPNTKKKKTTKKYAELKECVELVEAIIPFVFPKGLNPLRTESNQYSVNKKALIRYRVAAKKRLETVQSLKRYLSSHAAEEASLKKSIEYTLLRNEYSKYVKMKSAYTQFSIMPDGKVHGKFKVHGTATGRFSSGKDKDKSKEFMGKDKSLNVQTIPAEAKHLFVAEPGKVFINADFTNLEIIVLRYLSDDDVLGEIIDKKLNLHDVNTEKMFGITKTNPRWKLLRRIAKVYIFRRNYGGGLHAMYNELAGEIEEFDLSYKEFERMDKAYFDAHPKYKEWRENIENKIKSEKKLLNAFGRIRIFYGSVSDAIREGLNFPIQSTAGDIMSKGLIKVYKDRKETKPFNLTLTVHDSLLAQTALNDVNEVANYLKDKLEQKHQIGKFNVGFPVDIEVGFSYGYMVDIEIWNKMNNPTRSKVEKYCKLMKGEEFLKLSVDERLKLI